MFSHTSFALLLLSLVLVANPVSAAKNETATSLYALGVAQQKTGDMAGAFKKFEAALEIDAAYAPTLNHCAWIHATSKLPEWRDGKKAVAFSLRAIASEQPKGDSKFFADALDTHAAAYAATGDFKKAIEIQKQSLEVVKRLPRNKRGNRYIFKLHLFYYSNNKALFE